MSIKPTIFALLFIVATANLSAQKAENNRAEIEIGPSNYVDNKNIFPFDKSGLIVVQQNSNQELVHWYNNDLKLSKSITLIKSKSLTYSRKKFANGDALYCPDVYTNATYILKKIATETLKVTEYKGTLPKNEDLLAFFVAKNIAYFVVTSKGNYFVHIHDMENNKAKSHAIELGPAEDKNVFKRARIDTTENFLSILSYNPKAKDEKESYITCIDKEGKIKLQTELKHPKFYLVDFDIAKIDDKYIIAGTYCKDKNIPELDRAHGIFSNVIEDGNITSTKTWEFVHLENYFNYNKSLKAHYLKLSEKGKNYNWDEIQLNNLIKQKDGFVLSGMAYSINKSDNNLYTYFNGFVIKINEEANIAWDNSLPMNDNITTNQTDNCLAIGLYDDDIQIMHANTTNIHRKQMDAEGVEMDKSSKEDITGLYAKDKIHSTPEVRAMHWYDDTFIVFGWQKVNNLKEGQSRFVFFITKLKY